MEEIKHINEENEHSIHFFNNAVNDELELTGAKDTDTKMCSYLQNDTEDICLNLQDGTCGECVSITLEGYERFSIFGKLMKNLFLKLGKVETGCQNFYGSIMYLLI